MSGLPSSSAAMLSSPHRDVLEAAPKNEDDKMRLVEEIKNRGRAAVAAKAYRDAEMLYEKAIALQPSEAPLYANLSLVKYQMGGWEESRAAAQTATEVDAAYVKGYWRLGQALVKLHRLPEALAANQGGLKLDPSNKAFKKEISVLEKRIKEEKELMDVEPTAPKTEPAEPIKPVSSKPKKKKEKAAVESSGGGAGEDIFTKSDHVKGYKVVNGKKTSYFHNELTEDAKRLIGDIAPKRLDASAAAPASSSSGPNESSGSAWNKAGTWEEKDVTSWAKESLKEALLATTFALPDTSPAPNALVMVGKVSDVDGHASFAMVRGKKRYIYEFAIKLEWEWKDGDTTARGKMAFPDFDGTCELGEGYDMTNWSVEDATSSGLNPLLDRFVKNGGFRDSLHQSLDDWVRKFRETY